MTTPSSHLPNPSADAVPQQTEGQAAGTENPDDPLCSLPPLGSDPYVRASTPPEILEAQDTFHRELPELLKKHRGKWVAYYGSKRIALEPTEEALLKECARQGYVECLTRKIYPYPLFDYISGI
jgi:hypothetical protein